MLHQTHATFMNSRVTVTVASNHSQEFVRQIVEQALKSFDHVINNFSRFTKTSELSILNSNSGKKVKVSNELFALIQHAIQLSKLTNYKFDPTVIDILEAYGYDNSYNIVDPLNSEVQQKIQQLMRNRPHVKDIELDEHKHSIKLAPNQRIDLGGIGKGYAIDLVYNKLSEKFDNYMINAGGDIRVSGTNANGKPWKIGLEFINDNKQVNKVGFVELTEGSICSSGRFARKIGNFHHLINTSNGLPENKTLISYAYADSAMLADSIATAAYLLGKQIRSIDVNQMGDNIRYLLLTSDNNRVTNSQDFF